MERHTVTEDPQTCPHAKTDHRGSNKWVTKTYCLDCGTYIESVPKVIVLDDEPVLSEEEKILINAINEHDVISFEQVIRASDLMLAEVRRVPNGRYTLTSIAKMFVDCADRAITSPTFHSLTGSSIQLRPLEQPAVTDPRTRVERATQEYLENHALVFVTEDEALVAIHNDDFDEEVVEDDLPPLTSAGTDDDVEIVYELPPREVDEYSNATTEFIEEPKNEDDGMSQQDEQEGQALEASTATSADTTTCPMPGCCRNLQYEYGCAWTIAAKIASSLVDFNTPAIATLVS